MKKVNQNSTPVYLIARVSSDEQDSNQAQINRLRDYAKKLPGECSLLEKQIKESSSKADRKKFQEIISEIEKSKTLCILIVDTIDRLQRSYRESVLLDEMRKQGKVEIHFHRENLVIHKQSNSADIIRWDMGVLFAKSYVLQLSDNVKRAFEQKRKDGYWIGNAPFGYDNVPRDKEKRTRADLIQNEREAEYVRKVFNMYASVIHSVKSICRLLKEKGVKTKMGNSLVLALYIISYVILSITE